jgi:hypothetical protein
MTPARTAGGIVDALLKSIKAKIAQSEQKIVERVKQLPDSIVESNKAFVDELQKDTQDHPMTKLASKLLSHKHHDEPGSFSNTPPTNETQSQHQTLTGIPTLSRELRHANLASNGQSQVYSLNMKNPHRSDMETSIYASVSNQDPNKIHSKLRGHHLDNPRPPHPKIWKKLSYDESLLEERYLKDIGALETPKERDPETKLEAGEAGNIKEKIERVGMGRGGW